MTKKYYTIYFQKSRNSEKIALALIQEAIMWVNAKKIKKKDALERIYELCGGALDD